MIFSAEFIHKEIIYSKDHPVILIILRVCNFLRIIFVILTHNF